MHGWPRMKVTPIVHEGTEHNLPAILAIYNEVIATSTAVYSLESSTLEERRTWFRSRRSMEFPVLVALDSANKDVLGFASFGEWRGAWPGYRYNDRRAGQQSRESRLDGIDSISDARAVCRQGPARRSQSSSRSQ